MPLLTRELELVIIARDYASSTIARVGGAVALVGGGIAALGVKGVRSLGDMAYEAAQFERQAALALTQVELLDSEFNFLQEQGRKLGFDVPLEEARTTVKDLSDIIRQIGTDLPIPFEELQEGLFDIFSTLDVERIEDAQVLLDRFATSALTGDAPVRDIARSTIAWLNALDQPANLENVNRLLDLQFELVRKGAGTYGEFASTVGKGIPAFVAANQTTETFSGILAFLTRNGLSAAEATTSAARAVELMFSPKAIEGIRDLGIALEDDSGKFRQMNDIIRDLVPIFASLSDADRKLKFKEIFGTGRIQARRFFDLAIPNFEELDELIVSMEDSTGELDAAFEIMFNQPAIQLELWRNRLEAVRKEIGEKLLPVVQEFVFPVLNDLWQAWEALDDPQRQAIVRMAAIGSAGLVAFGSLIILSGGFILLLGLIQAFGVSILFIGGLLAGAFAIGVALLGRLAYDIVTNWETWEPRLRGYWDDLLSTIGDIWDKFGPMILEKVEQGQNVVRTSWEAFVDWFRQNISPLVNEWAAVVSSFLFGEGSLADVAEATLNLLVRVKDQVVDILLEWGSALIAWIREEDIINELKDAIAAVGAWANEYVGEVADQFFTWTRALWVWVLEALPGVLEELGNLVVAIGRWITSEDGGRKLIGQFGVWAGQLVGEFIRHLPDIIEGLGKLLVDIGVWIVTDGIPGIWKLAVDFATGFIKGVVDTLKGPGLQQIVDALDVVLGPFINFSDDLFGAGSDGADEFVRGINSSLNQFDNPFNDYFGTLPPGESPTRQPISGGGSRNPDSPSGGVGGGGVRPITNIHINGTNKDARQLANEIRWEVEFA